MSHSKIITNSSLRNYYLHFLKELESALQIKEQSQWYTVRQDQFDTLIDTAGYKQRIDNIIKKFTNWNFFLQEMYPNSTWNPYLFQMNLSFVRNTRTFKSLASHTANSETEKSQHKEFFNTLLDSKQQQDENILLKLKKRHILQVAKEKGVEKSLHYILQNYYQGDMFLAFQTLYPNLKFGIEAEQNHGSNKSDEEAEFASVSSATLAAERDMVERFEKENNITKPEDWYNVTTYKITAGYPQFAKVLKKYNDDIFSLLKTVKYHDVEFNPLLRKRISTVSNNHTKYLKPLVEQLEKELKVQEKEDWYRVSLKQIQAVSKISIVRHFKGLYNLLMAAYPEYNWDKEKFKKVTKKSSQRVVYIMARTLLIPPEQSAVFPSTSRSDTDIEVLENHMLDGVTFSETDETVEIDVYCPKYKLGIEYQGRQHFQDIAVFRTLREYQLRDQEKLKLCKEHGVTLIVVPYSWKGNTDNLALTIHLARPDIPLHNVDVESLMDRYNRGVLKPISPVV